MFSHNWTNQGCIKRKSLHLRRWCRKLCLFYNILKNQKPQYLFNLISVRHSLCTTRNVSTFPFLNTKHSFFKNSFFPLTIIEWNKLDTNLRNSRSPFIFKKYILQFIRPSSNSVYNSRNPKVIKFVTRLCLGLSHLREHKFKHNFQDSIKPLCNCGYEVESTVHFFLNVLCSQMKETLSSALYVIQTVNCLTISIPF